MRELSHKNFLVSLSYDNVSLSYDNVSLSYDNVSLSYDNVLIQARSNVPHNLLNI